MRLLLSQRSIAGNKNRKQASFANNNFKKQILLKIKTQERRPRKWWLGGDHATFATLSRVPSPKNAKEIKNLLLKLARDL
jgi:hypothetical protein